MSQTISPKLTISTSGLTTSSTVNISAEDTLSVTQPIVGGAQASAPDSTSSAVTIVPANASKVQYVFIRHTGKQSNGTDSTTHKLVVQFHPNNALLLAAGEFAFFPLKENVQLNVISSASNTIQVEFFYYTAA
jgi:hypothetical protein